MNVSAVCYSSRWLPKSSKQLIDWLTDWLIVSLIWWCAWYKCITVVILCSIARIVTKNIWHNQPTLLWCNQHSFTVQYMYLLTYLPTYLLRWYGWQVKEVHGEALDVRIHFWLGENTSQVMDAAINQSYFRQHGPYDIKKHTHTIHTKSNRQLRFALTSLSTLVWPFLVTGFTQPLQIKDFITLDMLSFIPLHFLCTHFWQLVKTNKLKQKNLFKGSSNDVNGSLWSQLWLTRIEINGAILLLNHGWGAHFFFVVLRATTG